MAAVISWLVPGAPRNWASGAQAAGGQQAQPLFPLHQSDLWVAARWQWKPSCCLAGTWERAPPCGVKRSASPRHPAWSTFCISGLMLGTLSITQKKLLSCGPAFRSCWFRPLNDPSNSGGPSRVREGGADCSCGLTCMGGGRGEELPEVWLFSWVLTKGGFFRWRSWGLGETF